MRKAESRRRLRLILMATAVATKLAGAIGQLVVCSNTKSGTPLKTVSPFDDSLDCTR
jgi:hypothetical protein